MVAKFEVLSPVENNTVIPVLSLALCAFSKAALPLLHCADAFPAKVSSEASWLLLWVCRVFGVWGSGLDIAGRIQRRQRVGRGLLAQKIY